MLLAETEFVRFFRIKLNYKHKLYRLKEKQVKLHQIQ